MCIRIEDLRVSLRIGILDAEKTVPQDVLILMDLFVSPDYLENVTPASIVDYGSVTAKIMAWEAKPHVLLLETLAQDLVALAFSYDAVEAVRVTVRKPDIIPQARSVGIEVVCKRDEYTFRLCS